MTCNASYTRFIFGKFFICTTIWYAFYRHSYVGKIFILVKSGCYSSEAAEARTGAVRVGTWGEARGGIGQGDGAASDRPVLTTAHASWALPRQWSMTRHGTWCQGERRLRQVGLGVGINGWQMGPSCQWSSNFRKPQKSPFRTRKIDTSEEKSRKIHGGRWWYLEQFSLLTLLPNIHGFWINQKILSQI
jgi:hypothetical protein